MTTYPSFRQVVLDSLDARASAEFYRRLLGLRYLPGHEVPADGESDVAGHDWLVLTTEGGERLLAFQHVPTLPASTWPDPTVPQQLHLDFRVDTVAELDAQHERVLRLGGRCCWIGPATPTSRCVPMPIWTAIPSASSCVPNR